jgi:hypothetical protein
MGFNLEFKGLIHFSELLQRRSRRPSGVKRRYAAVSFQRLRVRITPWGHGYLSVVYVVCCERRGLCFRADHSPRGVLKIAVVYV